MNTESTNAQDARVEALWTTLDTRRQGQVDLAGLKKGLKKLDHPLKNADHLLSQIMKTVDTDGDGRIQYNEFRTFITQTEKELWRLFKSIDHNNDGKLSKAELQAAFRREGLAVPMSRLNNLFVEIDTDHDGVISFEEWRDFLLFNPAPVLNLHSVLSYFSASMKVNPEGDVHISDDTIQGLGILHFFLKVFFGSLFLVAKSPPYSPLPIHQNTAFDLYESPPAVSQYLPPHTEAPPLDVDVAERLEILDSVKSVLISCVPNPGYFVAGGIAGVASRTATAPLDRLKVYLIAQTSANKEVAAIAKSGHVFRAATNAWRPLATATKELWHAGGIRSLYAGNGLNVVKVMPESAIKFGSYEAAKRVFAKIEGHNDPGRIHSWSKFISGGLAGMVSQFAVYPIDTLKFRMQCETVSGGLRGNQLIIATAKKMWRNGGVANYYRGLPMGLFGIFPYAALDLGTFEYLKRFIATRNAKLRGCHEEDAQPGGLMTAAIGGFSGAFGATAVYPVNVLRTRLQSQGTVLHPRTYTGILDVTRQTYNGEGARGFFRGLTPNLLKVVPAVSITYVVYDKSKLALGLT
ncbi:calcium dependent mitochondrial carrier protein-like protein [Delitschia confertaspora ATCC 74209]|uniref:Mitochondrial thiamine pyrophosphate carrier 1 n=1 Tax=Delitschia confertaspora ATCC 74209 TaxID=1513339 RepID=A0A9P4JLY7_9PLEO|nr:calcium dependent mitochondrial carrier protein-like protein [Delitschia confertaspora ATCC 74209]